MKCLFSEIGLESRVFSAMKIARRLRDSNTSVAKRANHGRKSFALSPAQPGPCGEFALVLLSFSSHEPRHQGYVLETTTSEAPEGAKKLKPKIIVILDRSGR